MKTEPNRVSQGISFELSILRAAKEHAVSKRMSLSAYVNQLIFDDINGGASPTDGLKEEISGNENPPGKKDQAR